MALQTVLNSAGDLPNSKISSSQLGTTEENVPEMDFDEEIVHGMTASYTEISFNTQSSEPDDSVLEDFNDYMPETEPFSEVYRQKVEALERPNKINLISDCTQRTSPLNHSNSRAPEFLNHLNGTVIQDGPLVSFVAEDLETKIKLSSPEKSDDMNVWSSGMPWLYRQALSRHMPEIDSSILTDLEIEVGKIATSVDSLTENLAGILHSMSALTVECLESYRDVVCKTCDAVDLNIKSMYQLMAKCEELSRSMKPIYKLAEHFDMHGPTSSMSTSKLYSLAFLSAKTMIVVPYDRKEIKHFLDVFENAMN